MSQDIFQLNNRVEYRTDNPDYVGYTLTYNGQRFMMYYFQNKLKEVYFLSYSLNNYFMSCRADMQTISHYYVEGDEIRRYENGVHNRTYYKNEFDENYFIENRKKVVYKSKIVDKINNSGKIYKDLLYFLHHFYKLGLDKYFNPIEPK